MNEAETRAEHIETPYFDDYRPDIFDFVIVDECHRGGACIEARR